MRPLQRDDYAAGMLDVLRVLTTVGDVSAAAWAERFDWMKEAGGYFVLVVEVGGRVVGTGGCVVERKL